MTRRSELTIEADAARLGELQDFLSAWLEEADCPMKAQMQLGLAAEEIFINIASYAYAPGTGSATVSVELDGAREAVLRFTDHGIPYDPLAKPDPDVTLSAEERAIGGLGIFVTKKFMDEVSYEYRDGANILTIRKRF